MLDLPTTRQPLLDLPELSDRLFGDGERLHQDGDAAEGVGRQIEVALLFAQELAHESVALVDAALGKASGVAKILAAGSAGDAARIVAGAANGGHGEVAGFETGHGRAGFDDFPERLVTDDQVRRARGRRAVVARGDFFVGSADAGVEHAQAYFGR